MMTFGKCLLGAALFVSIPPSATAAEPPVLANDAWVRWLPGHLPAAGYVTLTNHGKTRQRLVGATSPDYAKVMIHRSIDENGVERMVASDGIDIAPATSISLAPGGYHLMLMQPAHPIAPGSTVTLHFLFASGLGLDARARVLPADATGPR